MKPSFPIYIDSSMRSAFNACPESFNRHYLQHLVPKQTSIHLNAGSAYAKGLEMARRAYYDDHLSPEDAMAEGLYHLIKTYGPHTEVEEGSVKSLPRIIAGYENYFARFPLDNDYCPPLILNDKASIEFSFAIPLPIKHPESDDPILYVGRFDYLGVFKDTCFPVDDKTTTRMGPTWSQQWELRSQFAGYCWAAREYGHPVAGAIVRGMCFRKNDTEPSEAIVYFTQYQLNEWYERLLWDVTRMISLWEKDYYPKTGMENAACSHYSGCSYRMLCTKTQPEAWIEDYFEVKPWNPVKGEEDEN